MSTVTAELSTILVDKFLSLTNDLSGPSFALDTDIIRWGIVLIFGLALSAFESHVAPPFNTGRPSESL
jgi:hypothetical protein